MRPGPTPRRRRPPADGQVEVFVADEQEDHPVDVTRWSKLVADVLSAEGVTGAAELSVLFVDEVSMTGLNRRFMEQDAPTDVLAFPLDDDVVELGRWPDAGSTGPDRRPDADEVPLLLGDVVVCPAVAAANAPDHAGTYEDELALLLVHGVLHVLGFDHADPEQARLMQQRERDMLERFHGPLAADPWVAVNQ